MLILCGKTASGKDTLLKELVKLGYKTVVSFTTRPMRQGETNGVEYNFVDEKTFKDMTNNGEFAETTSYKVASGETWYYGSRKIDLTDDKAIILNPEGLKAMKSIPGVNPTSFYLRVDEDEIANRLTKRGDNPKESARRLKADRKDFKGIEDYVDFIIPNDKGISPSDMALVVSTFYKHCKRK